MRGHYGSDRLLKVHGGHEDLGQGILQAAAEAGAGADAQVSVKVELVNGEIQYFTAQVMSYRTNVGNADAITMAEVTLEIDNSIVKD